MSSAALLADVVWPALVLEARILSAIPIIAGLLVEAFVLRFYFKLSWKKAALVDLVMNAVSTLVGIALIPLAGLAWEFFPGLLIYKIFKMGTFNPLTWAGTFVMAVVVTSAIEGLVMKWGFNLYFNRKRWLMLCAANCASVGIAFASILVRPPEF